MDDFDCDEGGGGYDDGSRVYKLPLLQLEIHDLCWNQIAGTTILHLPTSLA